MNMLKHKSDFFNPNRPLIVGPRLTEILQLINNIQADSKIVKLYEFSVDLK